MQAISDFIAKMFFPLLNPIFSPINSFLARYYEPYATACAVGLFIAAMVWVFSLRKEYVNLDAPYKHVWCDLRIWTVLSMLPHVFVYLYFK